MASPGSMNLTTFTELASSTFRKVKPQVADQVSKHNALYRRLNQKGRKRYEDGGLSIQCNLDYQANNTYQRYSGYDVLNIAASDVITAAEYQWRSVAVNTTISGEELRKNSGSSRIFNLVKAKITNAQRSMANGLSADLYSDGSAANQINGLQALISDSGTGTVGGINSSTWAFWQNIVQSAAAPLQGGSAITPSATTIESLLLPAWIRATRNGDMPDLIVMSDDYFTFYEQSQTSLKRYAPDDNGQGGMVSMKYKTADVFFDSSGGIPAAHAYMINTDFLELVVHQDADMEFDEEGIRSVNQDAKVMPLIWMGNLTCSARFLQAVIKA